MPAMMTRAAARMKVRSAFPITARLTDSHADQRVYYSAMATKGAVPAKGSKSSYREIPIQWEIPADQPVLFAQNIVLQHAPEEFTLNFFHIFRPFALNEGDIEKVEFVTATCVSRIVMPPSAFKTFLEMANTNYQNYVKQFGEPVPTKPQQ